MITELMTYQDWRDRGYQVKRGSIAAGTNEAGYKVFSNRQVFPIYKESKNQKPRKKK